MRTIILLVTISFFMLQAAYNFSSESEKKESRVTTNPAPDYLFNFVPLSTGMDTGVIDTTFIKNALENLYYEMKLSKLALQKSTSPSIKSLSQEILDNNGAIAQKLAQLIGLNEMFAAEEFTEKEVTDFIADSSDDPTIRKQIHTNYGFLSGDAFDKQWISDMQLSSKNRLSNGNQQQMKTTNDRLRTILINESQTIQQNLDRLQTIKLELM